MPVKLFGLLPALLVIVLFPALSRPSEGTPGKGFQPIAVGAMTLQSHSNEVPDRLLILRGYFSRLSDTGVPKFYATEADAKMGNDAAAFPVSFFEENGLGTNSACENGFAKANGYLDREFNIFRVFVFVPYTDQWEESDPCWVTSFDWRNHPDYKHLVPQQ